MYIYIYIYIHIYYIFNDFTYHLILILLDTIYIKTDTKLCFIKLLNVN